MKPKKIQNPNKFTHRHFCFISWMEYSYLLRVNSLLSFSKSIHTMKDSLHIGLWKEKGAQPLILNASSPCRALGSFIFCSVQIPPIPLAAASNLPHKLIKMGESQTGMFSIAQEAGWDQKLYNSPPPSPPIAKPQCHPYNLVFLPFGIFEEGDCCFKVTLLPIHTLYRTPKPTLRAH